MAAINAVEGDSLFSLSPRGTVTFNDHAMTTFTTKTNGNCRYQLPGDDNWSAKMLERIRNFNKMRATSDQ